MLSSSKIKNLPEQPGVYFFKQRGAILYIGKATNLRDRVKSYFGKDLMATRGPKLVKMLAEATSLDFKETDSVLEALILEAALIKKHQPKANTSEKDDKSFNYVVITREDFPRVLVVRGKDLGSLKFKGQNSKLQFKIKNEFGPFPHGLELREALKIIRKIFPYRDRCEPGSGTRCFNAQIGLCPGVCSGEMSKSEYAKVIRSISLMFQGKKSEILRGLHKHMREYAKAREFEKAAELRNKIFALTHINDIALMKRNLAARRLSGSNSDGGRGFRIEAYDIAHISGTYTVGSMVVMEDGVLAKDEYRRFKIKGKSKDKSDDTANLAEMLERRFKHTEWRMPDLIVIDGSIAQLNVARLAISNFADRQAGVSSETYKPEIVSVVKNAQHKPDHIMGDTKVVKDYHNDILLVNQEAHRFALTYHRLLRGKELQ